MDRDGIASLNNSTHSIIIVMLNNNMNSNFYIPSSYLVGGWSPQVVKARRTTSPRKASLKRFPLPSDSLRLMPGWYMLFGMVDDIPSVAQIVKIEAAQFVSATEEVPKADTPFRVFPNPAAVGDWLTIEMDSKLVGKVGFELTDTTGKAVQVFYYDNNIDNQFFTLKTADVPTGIYWLTARLDEKILGTQKVF